MSFLDKFKGKGRDADRRDDDLASMFDEVVPVRPDDMVLAGVGGGERLGLYGFGASATCTIQVARHWGCEVYVCTRSPAEQRRALDLGARWVGSYDESPPVELDAAITFAPSGDVVVSVVDGNLITSRNPDDIPAFNKALLDALG